MKKNEKIVNSDELYHWKYIQKKKVNGKWRYYYDIKEAVGVNARNDYINSSKEYLEARNTLTKLREQDAKKYKGSLRVSNDTVQADIYKGKKRDKFLASQKKYYKTPLGKMDIAGQAINKYVDKGKNKVQSVLKKVKKK